MQAAMRLALRGGFAAMTVRQIAREAQVAAGQLHHHFTSIGELKAQVFIRLIREMLDMPLVAEDASWRERLFSMIGSEDGRLEPYIRLWREGQVLADSDPDIKAAYLLTMNMWHGETLAIIEQGLASGEFRSAEPGGGYRLALYRPGVRPRRDLCAGRACFLDEAAFSRYVNKMITLELF